MKTAAAVLALLVAAFLILGALSDTRMDGKNAASNIDFAFANLDNPAAIEAQSSDTRFRKQSEEIRGIAGAAFLVAGLLLLKRSPATLANPAA